MLDIKQLTHDYETALATGNLLRVAEIVRSLNQEGRKSGEGALRLYERINQELFERGIRIELLDLEGFRLRFEGFAVEEIESGESKKRPEAVSPSTVDRAPAIPEIESGTANTSPSGVDPVPAGSSSTVKVGDPPAADDFIDAFVQFYNRHVGIFAKLKDYHFLELANSEASGRPSLLVIQDEQSSNNSLMYSLRENERTLNQKQYPIDQYIADRESDPESPDANYLAVICMTPMLGNDGLKARLEALQRTFDEATLIEVTSQNRSITRDDVRLTAFDGAEILKIQQSCDKVFSNRNLSYEEQKIIKQFFKGQPGIIDYRVIAGGMSGAVVLEVQFMPYRVRTSKRYVIKIARKQPDKANKLAQESQKFDDNVDLIPTTSSAYGAKYQETEFLEAIRYNFASGDSIKDSLSFRELIDLFLKDEIEFDQLQMAIQKLFACGLYQGWNAANPETTQACGDLYKRYLEEDGTLNAIKEITDKDISDSPLVDNYKVIKDYELRTKTKICHGDLHSENFFFDGEEVYLIDFAWTDAHHSLVDHAFLEASIRFKHFPRFISPEELATYDGKFMDLDSFTGGFDMSFVSREKVSKLYSLIESIRIDARRYMSDPENPLEYLIALFLITFRLVQYKDLYQLYALEFGTALSKRIIELLPKPVE